jgi:hypothetical protein
MANVTFVANPQPAPACYPADVNGLLQMIAGGGLSGTIPDTAGGGIYVGSTAPSSALTNKVWFKTDGAGRPIGVYQFYNGNWRPVYSGWYGEIRVFAGNPGGLFDGTGRGVIGQPFDGWALCNGQNGTLNMANRFIVGSYGFDGSGWVTSVEGAAKYNGGVGTTTLQSNNLPSLQTPSFGVMSGPITGGGGAFIGAENATFQNYWRVRDGSGNIVGGQVPFTNCPPYYAFAFIQFIGYA